MTVDVTPSATALRQAYAALLRDDGWHPDAAQRRAVDALAALAAELDRYEASLSAQRWWRPWRQTDPPRGLYLWGGVGRGKTYLMDLFRDALQVPSQRSHFHRFMYEVHEALRRLDGQRDPLLMVAQQFASRARVLCFDEFFVSDIGDAMILGRLLGALIDCGVVIVATSNSPPDALYADGLQRARFLPAIARLQQHCRVLEIDGGNDYRLQVLDQRGTYYTPSDAAADAALAANFKAIAGREPMDEREIVVNGRAIPVRAKAPGVGWFDFRDLCETARSQNDYIALARRLHTVLISDVRQMTAGDDDAARRFIALVDEFYDRKVNLLLAAAAPIDALYVGKRLAFAFERTRSRLTEMQSREYLSAPHRA